MSSGEIGVGVEEMWYVEACAHMKLSDRGYYYVPTGIRPE